MSSKTHGPQAYRQPTVRVQAASTTITVTSATTIAKLIANLGNPALLNRLRPLSAGTATIASSFGGKSAADLSMTIGSSAVTIQSVSLVGTTWCTSGSADVQCSVTFAGTPGTTNVLEVAMHCGK